MTRRSKGWVTCQKPRPGARLRLLCFPFAGGGTFIYRGWHEALPSFVEVCAVQLPGRERRIREEPFTTLDALIPALAAGLEAEFDRPYVIFGHSMGGLIGFELIRWLRQAGKPLPVKLFVSGRQAPPIPESDPPIHGLPHDEFLEELRRHNGTPDDVLQSPELLELILPTLRADFRICETYVCREEPPLDCPISVFGGEKDDEVPMPDLCAWQEETTSSFAVHTFPGDHFFIHTDREAVLLALKRDIMALDSGRGD